jgi:hypothetical protein
MSKNPEQDAFRLNDKTDETQKQTEDTSQALLRDAYSAKDKTTVSDSGVKSFEVEESSDSLIKSFAQSLQRINELASRLPADILSEVIDNNRGHCEQTLLAGIDPRNAQQREEIMGVLNKALRGQNA